MADTNIDPAAPWFKSRMMTNKLKTLQNKVAVAKTLIDCAIDGSDITCVLAIKDGMNLCDSVMDSIYDTMSRGRLDTLYDVEKTHFVNRFNDLMLEVETLSDRVSNRYKLTKEE